jgi:N-acyl-D-aspartate/D-glutamate deacylase
MAALAAYASSEQGQILGMIADRWGVDPAAGFTDPILATNFRLLLMRSQKSVEMEPDDWEAAGAALEREWTKG